MMDRSIGRRASTRYEVFVEGTLRTGCGSPAEIKIRELSQDGCCFDGGATWLKRGSHVSLRIGAIGPIEAVVRWVEEQAAGVQFQHPLYEPVFEELCRLLNAAGKKSDRRNPVKRSQFPTG